MPGIDGVETARILQNDVGVEKAPPVIMVTSYGREDVMEAAQGVRNSGVLTKPVTPSTLLDTSMLALGQEITGRARAHARQEQELEAQVHLRGAHILLVEDNEINQELALELLANAGVTADVATNGQEALDILAEQAFDGVLMDVQMPVMDGYAATREIRKQDRFKDLPVIAMTANAMAGDREQAIAVGMDDHIAKPINVREMLTTMARWISPGDPLEAGVPADEPAIQVDVGQSGAPLTDDAGHPAQGPQAPDAASNAEQVTPPEDSPAWQASIPRPDSAAWEAIGNSLPAWSEASVKTTPAEPPRSKPPSRQRTGNGRTS